MVFQEICLPENKKSIPMMISLSRFFLFFSSMFSVHAKQQPVSFASSICNEKKEASDPRVKRKTRILLNGEENDFLLFVVETKSQTSRVL